MSTETLEHFQARRKEARRAGFQRGEQQLLPTSPAGPQAAVCLVVRLRLPGAFAPGKTEEMRICGGVRRSRKLPDFFQGLKWLGSGTSPLEEGQKGHDDN